jgi:hypothetical protein
MPACTQSPRQCMLFIAATRGPQDHIQTGHLPQHTAPFGRDRSTPSEATGIIEPHDLRSLDLRDNR